MAEKEYKIPDHAAYDLGEDIVRTAKRRRFARRLVRYTSFIIAVFIVISYLGYSMGQYFANSTSLSVRSKMPEIKFTQVGFRLSNPIDSTDSAKYNLQLDTLSSDEKPGYVYWTTQDVSPQVLSFVLKHEKYSHTSKLTPVTSRFFIKNQDLLNPIELYDRPRLITNIRANVEEGIAEKEDYMALQVLFRLGIDNDVSNAVSLDNIGIYFARDTKFTGSADLLKAVRLGFQSEHAKDIISPGRKEPKVANYVNYIDVGGKLDLDGPNSLPSRFGYYDYTIPLAGEQYGEVGEFQYEIGYGDFEMPLTNVNWGPAVAESDPIPDNHDVNTAATYQNVRPLINYVPAKQYYTNFEKYMLIANEGEAVAYTNEFGIAEINIKIWLEGWDEYATDNIVGSTFGSQLKFEVSKKDLG